MHAQIDRLAYAHTSFFTSEPAEALAEQLIRTAPAGMSHAYFVSGGSEAVEAALKMARQYFVEIGQPQRAHFIARRQSYHGNTLGALAVGGNEWRRREFKPLLIDVTHVSPCYPTASSATARRPRPTVSGSPTSWTGDPRTRDRTRSSPSLPKRSAARRQACSRPCPATSRRCAKCATVTACC